MLEAQAAVRTTVKAYSRQLVEAIRRLPSGAIEELVDLLMEARLSGQMVYVFGNGGSAATAAHMAADLAKNTRAEGVPHFRVLSLADNTATLTALANDQDYADIFAEPLRALGRPGDVAIAISASGNSPNVLRAVEVARDLEMRTVGLIGFGGGQLCHLVDLPITVGADDYGPIEDVHLIINHMVVCALRDLAAVQAGRL